MICGLPWTLCVNLRSSKVRAQVARDGTKWQNLALTHMLGSGVRRLDSWKEIAEYLGRDLRTVMRWEQERGLPVHRVPGGKRAVVFAHPEEIERWLEGATTPPLDSAGPDGDGSGSPVASDAPRSGSELA
jgi:excisionase family DNA binding protein